ncbi:uncharacterized protein LOC125739453 isoform X1 [Brienomyrus brachyistius]|uniref:uncharacterized protein LOC125739453 isoform X1 n=2 Tax=Brienomyrus brachyistius TaxID=42636 RepID=UPI0020B4461F|nr:uncharacterized protein LOC125739453 isoform X1 [Brienomyrus brachyistius]XP_048865548.1 uncharacterized protein LOC125739453 isoform X1 [Brienomyrus brachyistius]
MFSDQPLGEAQPTNTRPRRHTRLPARFDDYDVYLPAHDRPHSPMHMMGHIARMPEEYHDMERAAKMTPLEYQQQYEQSSPIPRVCPRSVSQTPYGGLMQDSTPSPQHKQGTEASPEILEAINQLRQDNHRLQLTMMQMQRQLSVHTPQPTHISQQPVPSVPHTPFAQPPHQELDRHLPVTHESTKRQGKWAEEDAEWPLPPPPVVHEALQPSPTTEVPQGLVEELTDCLRRLGRAPQPMSYERQHLTPVYCEPEGCSESESQCSYDAVAPKHVPISPEHQREIAYRGPKPTIPYFTKGDPREFARLKIALDNILPEDATERFKYQILVDHIKFEEALLIADSYMNSKQPYSNTMASLTEHYGQPHQLALRRIAELMDAPNIRSSDASGFKKFALRVRALVGMLDQLGESGHIELQCGSHVTRLLSKLPQDMRAEFKRYLYPQHVRIPTLLNFADWLEYEIRIQESGYDFAQADGKGDGDVKRDKHRLFKPNRTATILHGADQVVSISSAEPPSASSSKQQDKSTAYCPYCVNSLHYLNQCGNFSQLTVDQKTTWVKSNRRCWRCGRSHQAAQCRLKMTCKKCNGKHLDALHELNTRPEKGNSTCLVSSANEVLYLDRRAGCSQVLLKVSKVILRNGEHSLETYAILDDGSERTILLPAAAHSLKLQGNPEDLALRTVRQDIRVIHGTSVTFTISPASQPQKTFRIQGAFTADQLGLAEHTYAVKSLQRRYKHLRGLPLQAFDNAHPLVLIGSDYPHLITPVEPVHLGPPGGPAAVKTRLGWTLQGPTKLIQQQLQPTQCLHVSTSSPAAELFQQVERLWQLDVLPYRNEKLVTRSKQDQEAMRLLEEKTSRVDVEGVQRYATPLLRVRNMPKLNAPKEAVLAHLRSTERRLLKEPEKAASYCAEMRKLEQAGYTVKVSEQELNQTSESWYIPHHIVSHNEKNRIVYNCSFTYQGNNLNDLLLPGPTLTSSLLGVLLRFREHSVAFSSDIKGMFHQVRLLPEDKPLLRFLWRDLQKELPPNIYEWQVLPFGTTCSPCCATFALQKHVFDHSQPGEDLQIAVERCFYVDNCLKSLPSKDIAKHLVDQLQAVLAAGGFELRQWASNTPEVINHLPKELRSDNSVLWLNGSGADPQEQALGLRWSCHSDTLGYKCRLVEYPIPTMRNIYRVLASLYDPLGFLIPFTTRAKTLVQHLWSKQREWDDPSLPDDALQAWSAWVEELQHLPQVTLPRCYVSPAIDRSSSHQTIHIFCDASERAYGSVAYLRSEGTKGQVEVAFLTARSRVAPKRQLSMPRLELCAALTGSQLAALLLKELTITIHDVILWTDSTTVLTWLQSDSCQFKVFVGTRVAEIQELTDAGAWRYVDSASNPADDITRGKTLRDLAGRNRWRDGPSFLLHSSELWPTKPAQGGQGDSTELRKPTCIGLTKVITNPPLPDYEQFSSFRSLVEAVALSHHGAAGNHPGPSAEDYQAAEREILRQAQLDSFIDDYTYLAAGKLVSSTSRLVTLAPEYDAAVRLIRVGGRLRHSDQLEHDAIHPIVLDPAHKITKLIIQDTDKSLKHPGAERLFAELRRKYWILHGREAVKRHQRSCPDCQRWRASPTVPKMADLPPARLRLLKPPFFSTGVDCFGPFMVRIGRRNEKRWGILFKCLTTRAVHVDILSNLDTDSFLMGLRRFIARRGKPAELLSDQGTNFKGGERELHQTFQSLHPILQQQLAKHQIKFRFNPPGAPHFGGVWEREIRSVKAALYTTVQAQTVTEEVLRTVLVEVEGILNSKPLGYVSTDIADPDPVTPNLLLMGRLDPSLPQAVYTEAELLSRRRWKHSQVLADQFWVHFIKYYLPALQTRSKWQRDAPPLQLGTVVLIMDPHLPRALWPVGRVTKVIPGVDGRVRTADVQVKDHNYTRPVARLIPLPAIPDTTSDPDSPF